MSLTTATGRAILTPEDVAALLVQPVTAEAVPGLVGTAVQMTGSALRAPAVQQDPTAAWVAEGAEIAASDAVFAEVTAPARKVAGLTVVSSELATDSDPAAVATVGEGLTRDIVRQINRAFVGDLAAPAPSGLGGLTGATTVPVGAAWTNLDPFVDAQAAAALVGARVDSWIISAADFTTLAKLKSGNGSNAALLAADPTRPEGTLIGGAPVVVSPDLPAGTAYGIPRDRVLFGVRQDAEVVADPSVFFTSDRVAVRATMRCAFAFPHPEAVIRLVVG